MKRFWDKVNKNGPLPPKNPELGHCWLWLAGCSGDGYGAFWFEGKTVRAHRFSLWLVGRNIPEGMQPDHLCEVTICIRPEHIKVTTPRDNVRRTDSPPAENARKTHCLNGHLLSGNNLYTQGVRRRVCITCRRQRRMARYWSLSKQERRFA